MHRKQLSIKQREQQKSTRTAIKKREEHVAASVPKRKISEKRAPKPQQYKASLLAFAEMWELERRQIEARPNIKEKLKQTHFWPLIEAYDKNLIEGKRTAGMKYDLDVARILKWYDWKKNVFKFGNGVSQVSTDDVVHIFGLKNEGIALPKATASTKGNVDASRMIKAYFIKPKRVKKEDLKTAFKEAYDKNTDQGDEDAALILIMYLLMTLLLANSGVYLPWCYIKCCESIEGLNKYNFADGVLDYLFTGLKKAGKAREEARLAYFPTISGCVILIMIWICERSGLIDRVAGHEHEQPAAVRWNLATLHQILEKTPRIDIKMNNATPTTAFAEDSEEGEPNDEDNEGDERNDEDSEPTSLVLCAPAKRMRLAQSPAEKKKQSIAPSVRTLRSTSWREASYSSSAPKQCCLVMKNDIEAMKTKLEELKKREIEMTATLNTEVSAVRDALEMLQHEVGEKDKELEMLKLEINLLKATQQANAEARGNKDDDEPAHREQAPNTPTAQTEAGEILMQLACSGAVDVPVVQKGADLSLIPNPACDPVPSIIHAKKKLLILDLNGLLADIVGPRFDPHYQPSKKLNGKNVFKRPYCDDFLQFCFEKFEVGVWTSRTRPNATGVVDYLFGVHKEKLLFFWDQRHCSRAGLKNPANDKKPIFLKELRKIWGKTVPGLQWENGAYNASNTLLLDDTPYKALRNPVNTAIFPPTYHYNQISDEAIGPSGELRTYLAQLADADNVQSFVEQNPFGQPAIRPGHVDWELYRNIVSTRVQ